MTQIYSPSTKSGSTTPKVALPDFVITPDQVVGMLLKSDHVMLQGFGGVSQKLPFWIPVAVTPDVKEIEKSVQQKRQWMTRLHWALVSIMAAAALLLVIVTALLQPSSKTQGAWSVQVVQPQGVLVSVGLPGQSSAVKLTIPVGAMLPNGDILRSVDSTLQSYSTDTQITVVKK